VPLSSHVDFRRFLSVNPHIDSHSGPCDIQDHLLFDKTLKFTRDDSSALKTRFFHHLDHVENVDMLEGT
jgi:hypothetical protein